ncbi:MAG: glutamine amidotransferase [Bryobacteraceae bacterium]
MFEFFFKYPASVFSKGTFVLAGGWPIWLLILAILGVGVGLAIYVRRSTSARVKGGRSAVVWLLQTLLASVLLLLLWHPALSVATLRPQQNIVAVVVDDSSSMAVDDSGSGSRENAAKNVLNSGLVKQLQDKFQVRLYKLSDNLSRLEAYDKGGLDKLTAAGTATHIGEGLKQVLADAASLPIGAVVLLSDGADNSGGIDLETISEVRRQRIPVHTIGFGREKMAHDVEMTGVETPARALPDSRLSAAVSFHQHGYEGQKAKVFIKDGAKILAARDITFKPDGVEQTENILYNAGPVGVKAIEVSIDPLPSEENQRNNKVVRLVNVDKRTPRILYMEGEPRWEFKFLRRAVEDDTSLHLSTILRTTQNKIYVQDDHGDAPKTIKDGFPNKIEDLFEFDGLILGSVDAPYFTATQQQMIKDFVDRRGGGLLFLGGRDSLADGGYARSVLNDVLPVKLPDRKNTFVRDPANVELTAAGRDSLITRIEEDPQKNVERWKKLPYLMNFQVAGEPKPGATVLVDALPTSVGKIPLLTIENFGRGRTAVFATAGSWRWKMLQPVADRSHAMFYTQLLRWLVNDTPRRLTVSTPRQILNDESAVKLRADVRDKAFLPAADATVEAHILGDGVTETVEMRPDALDAGGYTADWTIPKSGSYVVEVTARRGVEDLGRDVMTFRRNDGVAENFHVEQNRELLEKLSAETGGKYYKPEDAHKLGKDISYSEAGITVRETRDLWDMPVIFLLLLMLRSGEWLLRRKWGVI